MRDVTGDRPFIIFTPQDPKNLPAVRQRLVDAGLSYKELWAVGDGGKVERPCFLVDFANHRHVELDPDVIYYLAADAFKICSMHCKVPELGPEVEVLGTLEQEPPSVRYDDAIYRFRDGTRRYVIR